MKWKDEWKPLAWMAGLFLACYFLPVGQSRFEQGLHEALELVKWYAREHVLLCLVPAFFIAGGIGVFVSQASVMKYLGPKASKPLAYGVASVSGTILAVCSCTVLPLFAGIYRMGAGLGPASAFLYSGPAISALAIILTARILGMEIGLARAIGAILFSLLIGLLMHLIFRKEEEAKAIAAQELPESETSRPLWQTTVFFAALTGILIFANWGKPGTDTGAWHAIWAAKWWITGGFALLLGAVLVRWYRMPLIRMLVPAGLTLLAIGFFPGEPVAAFAAGSLGLAFQLSREPGEAGEWFAASWGFAKQILPLLLGGVFVAGFLLGRPGMEGVIPNVWVEQSVGGNSWWANLAAAVGGAFMYFATLTEVPVLQGLMGSGMGKGPALALLLAGPALSLPSMIVLNSILGFRKTAVYVSLVIVMSWIAGMIFGAFA
jgi:uncharacterized membrane protein YraQ (UPF0718 family)